MIATDINNDINNKNLNRFNPMSFMSLVYSTFVILMYDYIYLYSKY